jgi:hypothetical protein
MMKAGESAVSAGKASSPRRNLFLDSILILSLMAVFVFGTHLAGLTRAKISADPSLSTYASQTIVNGDGPYGGYVIMHPPLAYIPGALSLAVGRQLNITDEMAIRFAILLMALANFVLIYYIGRNLTGERLAGLLSSAAFGWNLVILFPAHKSPTKMIVVLMSLMMCLAVQKRHWTLSGAAAAGVFLSWAGAGVLIPVVLAAPLLQREEPRWPALVRVTAGGGGVLAAMIIYLASQGTLLSMWRQYPVTVYRYITAKIFQQGAGVPVESMDRITLKVQELSPPDQAMLLLGVLGLMIYLWGEWRRERSLSAAISPPRASVIIMSSFLLWAGILFDVQNITDLVPLVPFLGIWAAWLIWRIVHRGVRSKGEPWSYRWATGIIILIMALLSTARILSVDIVGRGKLGSQRLAARWMDMTLEKDKPVQGLGNLTPLVLTRRPNATRVIHLGPKSFMAMESEGWTLKKFIEGLEEIQPRLIIVDMRNWNKSTLRPLLEWLEAGHTRIRSRILNLYAIRTSPDATLAALGMRYSSRWPWLMKADFLQREGDLQGAASSYRRSAAMNSQEAAPLILLGNLYREQGRTEESRRTLKKAAMRKNGRAWARIALGNSYTLQEEQKAAYREYRAAFRTAGGSPESLPFPMKSPPNLGEPGLFLNLSHPSILEFGRKLFMLGYEIEPAQAVPGGVVSLTLYWWSLDGSPDKGYVQFNWVTDSGERSGQGKTALTLWYPGIPVLWSYSLPVPENASPGEPLQLVISVRLESGGRESPAAGEFPPGQPLASITLRNQ